MADLVVADLTIKQDSEGRYCLNDLHRAAGGLKKHQITNWLRNEQTQELITELGITSDTRRLPMTRTSRMNGGTFVVKELVCAYAMWISPAFQLKVIRAFDTLQTQGIAVAEHAAEDVLNNPMAYLDKKK